MYNNSRYNDKVVDVVVTNVVKNNNIYEVHNKEGVVATTKFDSRINQIQIGKVNKLHIRQDYATDNSYFLKVI